MDAKKLNEFKALIQAFIDANGEEVLGKRVYWKNFPEKIAANAAKSLKIPETESVMMIIDSTIMGSGKAGMTLTDWGIRYNDGTDSWSVSWNELPEKYIFENGTSDALVTKIDALFLQAKPGDDLAITKEISMPMASIKYDLLARLLNKVCQIFTSKEIKIIIHETVDSNGASKNVISNERIRKMIAEIGQEKSFSGYEEEANHLSDILSEDERILFISSCILNNGAGLITCTNKRLIYLSKVPIIGWKQVDIMLDNITQVTQPFGFLSGKINIVVGSKTMSFENLEKEQVAQLASTINNAINALKNRNQTVLTQAAPIDEAAQLEKFDELRKKGIISDEEFQAKKKQILGM